MPAAELRDQIDRARRLIVDHLSHPDALRRQEQRLVAWGEPAGGFLETVGFVLGLALFQAQRGSAQAACPQTGQAMWQSVTRLLDPQAAGPDLFADLPTDLDSDVRRQIQALRLASTGISPASTIRWVRLLSTAYAIAEHQA
ncbi:hypothetical protein OG866_01830 [Streptomyces sp. NBC_00663]|uniref:hypothetical protein n=1 Tax=Streptomyces sp. NBC_00663 TaxID=2975801 RepID=UPI002E33D08B|nr:hypothetical protein [Streptomyces sp. NBC_00663]